jgi:CRISPR-associated protein Csx10
MKFYLEMSLRSETCFAGSGGGRIGNVDVDLELDPQTGLPIIRGRTLKGLLLEELALILHTLEPVNPAGHWHIAAAHLFGTRGQTGYANLIFQDGQLPADVRAAVRDKVRHKVWNREEVLAALTTVRYQTKVDAKTGAPEARSLRSSRVLRTGLHFRALVHARQPLTVADQALLAACAAAVRRVGLHRNHGWGEVQLRVLNTDKKDVTADWLAGLRQPLVTAAITSPDVSKAPTESQPTSPAKQVLSYRLTLTTPAILAAVSGDFTTVETRPYISGGAVLGALAWRWLARQPNCADPASNPDFQRYFLSGSVRWLNAYPEGTDNSRLLPCPLSLVQRKNETDSAFDKAHPNFAETVQQEPDTQWQPLDECPFVRLQAPEETGDDEDEDREAEGLPWRLYGRPPKMTPRLHHTRDDREAGRSKDGQMFSYVALEAGEQFIGHILCGAQQDADTICDLLNAGPIPLGRSRTATYGGWAKIKLLSESDRETWQEAPQSRNQDRLVVTLLSDYLGVNDAGLPDPRALEQDVKTALGIDQSPIACFLGTRLVTGYVSHWRMPRPSHPAVKAGSVLVYRNVQPDPEKLKNLYWRGIGVRRAEGFGRVAVNWHGAAEEINVEEESVFFSGGDNDDEDVIPTTPSPELNYLKRHLLFDALQRVLIDYAVICAGQVQRLPSAALVGRLRARVRTAAKAEDVQDFLDAGWRPADKGLKKAGQALVRARLGQHSLTEWLRAWMLGDKQDPTPGWMNYSGVVEKCERLQLSLDLLRSAERWTLLQTFLDAFCELLRRRAQDMATA